jgi:transcription initiation factor IIE alpha subunit
MKNEITIPVLRKEGLVDAIKRSERYSLIRDIQATEFNDAIVTRLEKEKEKLMSNLNEDTKQVLCAKCGKEFSIGIATEGLMNCPECK